MQESKLWYGPKYVVRFKYLPPSQTESPDCRDSELLRSFLARFGIKFPADETLLFFHRKDDGVVEMQMWLPVEGHARECEHCGKCQSPQLLVKDVGTEVPDFRTLVVSYGSQGVVTEKRGFTAAEQLYLDREAGLLRLWDDEIYALVPLLNRSDIFVEAPVRLADRVGSDDVRTDEDGFVWIVEDGVEVVAGRAVSPSAKVLAASKITDL